MAVKPIERAEGLSALVYREIERMIVSGDLEPGTRLNEYGIAGQLAVSRAPVREATRALVKAGLLVQVPARGVFVREMSDTEIAENYDVRALLTGLMCARAAERRTERDLGRLADFVRRMDEAAGAGRIAEYYAINLDFHGLIAAIADHGASRRIYDDLIRETHSLRRSLFAPGQTNDEHREIVKAIRAAEAERARALGEAHVLHGKTRWIAVKAAGPANDT